MTPSAAARALAGEIAHCPEMVECLQGAKHPCSRVVLAQWAKVPDPRERLERWPSEHHLPEPWVGNIEGAPLLFVSSNPAGSERRTDKPPATGEPYVLPPELAAIDPATHPSVAPGRAFTAPKWGWSYDEVFDKQTHMFDLWVDDGQRLRVPVGHKQPKPSKFWVAVDAQARALLGPDAQPGVDYALTEVVHCKSMRERGVGTAKRRCVPRYLERVLALSPARLVVVYGDHARNAIRAHFDYPDEGIFPSRPVEAAGAARRFAFLAHPGRTREGRPKELTATQLRDACRWLESVT